MERDSCIFYASQLLRIYAQTREIVMADSTYYIEAWLRMKESYDYAQDYYRILQKSVFIDGQTSWLQILKHPADYWRQAKLAMEERFSSTFILDFTVRQTGFLRFGDSVGIKNFLAAISPS